MWIVYMLVGIACGMDITQRRISNRLILTGLCIALVRKWILKGSIGIVEVLLLSSFPVFILYLFFLTGVLGAGDIKLFSLIGGFLNFKQLIRCIIYAFFAAAIFSLIKLMWYGNLGKGLHRGMFYLMQLFNGKRCVYQTENEQEFTICFSVPVLIGLWASQHLVF